VEDVLDVVEEQLEPWEEVPGPGQEQVAVVAVVDGVVVPDDSDLVQAPHMSADQNPAPDIIWVPLIDRTEAACEDI